ncbi:MAG: sulfur carrier protein ThiS [Acidimicrobiales bacterium]
MVEQLALQVNGQPLVLPPGSTVADGVAALGCGPRGVAVAVNSELVRKAEWPAAALAEGDKVEILHAVAGG